MNRLFSVKTTLAAAIVTAGLLSFGNASAEAGCRSRGIGYVDYTPPCTYKTVIDYELQTVEYVDYVTRYTSCGHPYTVKVIRTKVIEVPVQRLVKVCY